MTPEQEQHLEEIKNWFNELVDPKYRAGQKEHGGDLWDMNLEELLDSAIAESIDQVVYLLTMKRKLKELKSA